MQTNNLLKYLILILSGIIHSFAYSQDAEIMLLRNSISSSEGIRIVDEEGAVIFDDRITPFSDTAWIRAEKERRYFLEISDLKKSSIDSVYIQLHVNGVPVVLVNSDAGAGDHSIPFFSGIETPVLRIVGGTSVSISDYPWQVFVRAGNYLCGGTIIADKWVLTAAHCLYDNDNQRIPDKDIFFLAGTNDPYLPFPDGTKYNISYSVIHEEYNPDNYENDLALLRTSVVIDNPNARPINLIESEDVIAGATDPGKIATITGWGKTNVDPDEFPDRLQKLDIPVVTDALARSVWGSLPSGMLMAGYVNNRGDACSGDSGGPLIVRVNNEYKLAGVTSWGSSGCNSIGGYVRVSSFIDWLKKNTGISQNKFRTVRPFGSNFRCQNVNEGQSINIYTSDTITGAGEYEWKVEPGIAGTVSSTGITAEVNWKNDYFGEAYVFVRAVRTPDTTNWSGQRVFIGTLTEILSQPQDTKVCQNDDFLLAIQAIGSEISYTWLKDGVEIYSGRDSELLFTNSDIQDNGTYQARVTGACGTISSDEISVNVLPETRILSQTQNISSEQGSSFEIMVDAVGDNLTYTWTKDKTGLSDINSNSIYFDEVNANTTGSYQVRIDGTCTSKVSKEIYVFIRSEIDYFPDDVNIWPTVTRNIVNIALNNNQIFDVYVFNSMGVRVLRKINSRYKTSINMEYFAAGMYFVEIRLERESRVFRVLKI